MGYTFGAKAKAAIVAGSVALAVMPVTAFAAPQQMGQFGQRPGQMQMGQAGEGQFGGENMSQMDGQQPPAMPDGQQPVEGEQPPAMPDGQQPANGQQPAQPANGQQPGNGQQSPAGPMVQVRDYIEKFIDLLGIKVDQTALDEFFNSFGAPQSGAQQGTDTLGQA